jgi:hypothetical protein
MAIDINSLRKVKADGPPRILIYGPEKMGKTTLASEFPAPVFIQTEDGASGSLELDSFGVLESFPEVLDAMGALATSDHAFQTVVIDSLSELEKLIWREVCTRNNWQSIEQPGFGKGYVETDYVWAEFIEAFNYLRNKRGMTIVLIGHSVTDRFDDPETQSYSRYTIDLHKRAMAIVTREVDAILLVKKDVTIKTEQPGGKGRARADGGDTRWIYAQGRPAFQAGNRYDMPEKVMFKKGEGFSAIASFLPINRPAAAAPSKKAA